MGSDDGVSRMAVQPDGRIVVAGFYFDDVMVARVVPGTGLDPSFNGVGTQVYGFQAGCGRFRRDVAIEPGGKIDVAETASLANNLALTRFTSGGAFDPSLNGGATVVRTSEATTSPARSLSGERARCSSPARMTTTTRLRASSRAASPMRRSGPAASGR